MISVDKILNSFWSHLDDRQKDVLTGRFGLKEDGDSSTLAELGRKYGITRERIRQIESGAIGILREKAALNEAINEFIERSRKYLKNSGGVARREDFLEHHVNFMEGLRNNHIDLFMETTGHFSLHPEDREFWPFYYSDDESFDNARRFINEWERFLKSNKEEILSSKYHVHLKIFVKKMSVNPDHAENYIAISKKFHVNHYGDAGLAEWPEVKPVTIRDHIYIILKKENKPIHFVGIAELIGERNKAKRALDATVHNELIKDGRFVLVGRGIYGLAEQGYRPGTAREVIQRILKENGPMRTRELVSAVQKERFFKPNTVLVNLQNKKFFQRQADGTYIVRRK